MAVKCEFICVDFMAVKCEFVCVDVQASINSLTDDRLVLF